MCGRVKAGVRTNPRVDGGAEVYAGIGNGGIWKGKAGGEQAEGRRGMRRHSLCGEKGGQGNKKGMMLRLGCNSKAYNRGLKAF